MAKNMEPIEIPVLFVPDNAIDLHELGIDHGMEEERLVTFYQINMITSIKDKGRDFTEIFSGSESFICTIPYENLKTMIKFR